MNATIEFGGITAEVIRKNIKNVHLSVYPPDGRVRISAPERMSLDTIRLFAISKLEWIRRHQEKVREHERESLREYLDRESHYVWGRRVLLKIEEVEAAPMVEVSHNKLVLRIRPGSDRAAREAIVEEWYRRALRAVLPALITTWEPRLGVKAGAVFIRRMKTRWGSCNPTTHAIRLNTELARKPTECLEYVLVHELAHLIEPTHGPRFLAIMDRFLPAWRNTRELLNRLPSRHENWEY